MRSTGYVLAVVLLLIGALAARWGLVLLWTVGNEFEPRGTVGIVLVVVGFALLGAGSYGVWHLERS
ncbi:MAG TPA: hypothetical protein VF895_02630 [Gaiellaceae bacterium]